MKLNDVMMFSTAITSKAKTFKPVPSLALPVTYTPLSQTDCYGLKTSKNHKSLSFDGVVTSDHGDVEERVLVVCVNQRRSYDMESSASCWGDGGRLGEGWL